MEFNAKIRMNFFVVANLNVEDPLSRRDNVNIADILLFVLMLPGRKCVTIRGYNFEKSTVLVFNLEILTLPIFRYYNWKGCFGLFKGL